MNELLTDRLILRSFRESDYDDLYEFLEQLKNDEFEGYPGITYMNGMKYLRYRLGSEEFYAIELRSTGKVIGNIYCGLREYDAMEVGYIINRNFRLKGYGREALMAVIKEVFAGGTHRVYAECDPRNERSWRFLEKTGFSREAHLKQDKYFYKDKDGRPVWKDTFIYAMLNH